MDPRFPRRHTLAREQHAGRDLTLVWIPGRGLQAVEAGAPLPRFDAERPETWPAEGEPTGDRR